MPVFKIDSTNAIQLRSVPFQSGEKLQTFFETNLSVLLDLRLVASDIPTKDFHGGKIETLGIDSINSPVVIEFEKPGKTGVINKGLYYFDWLLDHQPLINSIIRNSSIKDVAASWLQPRLIIIGQNFTEYDKHALELIHKNIELWEYQKFADSFLTLSCYYRKIITYPKSDRIMKSPETTRGEIYKEKGNALNAHLKEIPEPMKDLFFELRRMILSLDTNQTIEENVTQTYIGFRHKKNICEMWVQKEQIKIWLDIPIELLNDPFKYARNVKGIGHWGTGEVEVKVKSSTNLNHILDLISQSEKYNR